jgi:nucleoid DNA-binding protein
MVDFRVKLIRSIIARKLIEKVNGETSVSQMLSEVVPQEISNPNVTLILFKNFQISFRLSRIPRKVKDVKIKQRLESLR